jgi:hypothetical protein
MRLLREYHVMPVPASVIHHTSFAFCNFTNPDLVQPREPTWLVAVIAPAPMSVPIAWPS